MPKDTEVLEAIKILKKSNSTQLIRIMKTDYYKLPYEIDVLADYLRFAVRDLCPPGFEVDR